MFLNETTLDQILDKLPEVAIAVVGDLFLDKYLDLDYELTEKSVETALDAYQVVRTRCYPGAGGTVLHNLASLGIGRLEAISVIGEDGEGYELLKALAAINVDPAGIIQTQSRATPTYTKPMLSQPSGPARELNRLDAKNRAPQGRQLDEQVIERLNEAVERVEAIIIADQIDERNNGIVTDAVRDHLAHLAEQFPGKLIFADSRSHVGLFRGVVTKPNWSELLHAVGVSSQRANDHEAVSAAAQKLFQTTGQAVFVTLGEQGILLVDGQGATHVPTCPVSGPIDIVGAGDSTTAGIVGALCCGATPPQAAELGCLVASITIGQLGVTGNASCQQVRQRFGQWRFAS